MNEAQKHTQTPITDLVAWNPAAPQSWRPKELSNFHQYDICINHTSAMAFNAASDEEAKAFASRMNAYRLTKMVKKNPIGYRIEQLTFERAL